MPAPAHLAPFLELLGTGGTTKMAERVFAAFEKAVPPDVAELQAEVERLRADYESACVTIADMHRAAIGEVRGPVRGVVEDVADVRAALQRLADAAGRVLYDAGEASAEVRADLRERLAEAEDAARGALAPAIRVLIEASSLGTPEVKAARANVPISLARAAVRRAAELQPDGDVTAVTTTDLLLAREAAASVAMDRDPRAQTIALPEVPAPGTDDDDDEIDWDDDEPDQAEDDDSSGATTPTPPVSVPAPRAEPPVRATNAQIRAWCAEHGVTCSGRGAIPRAARDAYTAAHQGGARA